MSTLADLQRRNLERMEAATDVRSDSRSPDPALSEPSSNEVSIIPSFTQLNDTLIDASNDDVNDVAHDGASEAVIKASKEQGSKPSRKPSDSRSSERRSSESKAVEPLKSETLKAALNTQLRAHLMEQLMPAGGKGPVTRLNVEMPEDLHQRLKQHCVKTRTPIKALINALIALYLEEEGEA